MLRSSENWHSLQLLATTLLVAQVAAALHYLPVSALGFGLILLGLLFAINNYFAALNAGQPPRAAAREPLIALGLFALLALLFR